MNMNKTLKLLWVTMLTGLTVLCTSQKKPEVTPQQVAEFNLQLNDADSYLLKYSYVSMTKAYQAYQDLLNFPGFKQKTAERFIQTALLLALREKELGIVSTPTLKPALDLIAQFPQLKTYSQYLDIVARIPVKTKGITGASVSQDKDIDEFLDWTRNNVAPINAHLLEKSTSSAFYAYLYISFHSAFGYSLSEKDNLARFTELYPNSILIKFRVAIEATPDPERLNELIQSDPEFYEACLFLGDDELKRGKVLSAEQEYLSTYEHIPLSTTALISLANVYFHTEEFETCLDFNDRALHLAPKYRDAILGKAMSLGYLGRCEEAIKELNQLLNLGNYYIGETHYWLAWNQNELGLLTEAHDNVEQAKTKLIGHYEVSSLAGVIAYNQERFNQAEKEFNESLKLNPQDCESYYYLGNIYGQRQDWQNSGLYFERAANCDAQTEAALRGLIKEIEASIMSQARKDKLVRKKKTQLVQTRLTKATALYNGAAGYFNAKAMEKALELAERAAAHPSFREKAQELINSIK